MSAQTHTASKILELIRQDRLTEGAHLSAQKLADRLRLSRSPVNDALGLLEAHGIVARKPNRGYFLQLDHEALARTCADLAPPAAEDIVTQSYFRLADELLRGVLPMQCSEALLRARYVLTQAQTQALLARVAQEGWAQRRPGYGWEFSSMMTTPDSLLQSYRLRLALEPAALLEPSYRIDKSVLARCRAAERHLLDGGIDSDSADQLHERGVRFHESLVEASGNPSSASTACGGCCRTARCRTAAATASIASSTWKSSTCSSASATKRPRRRWPATCAARSTTWRASAASWRPRRPGDQAASHGPPGGPPRVLRNPSTPTASTCAARPARWCRRTPRPTNRRG